MKFLMKFLFNNRLSWGVFIITLFIAAVSLSFLPGQIPIHFSGGAADSWGGKLWILIFPFIQLVFLLFFRLPEVQKGFTSNPKFGNSLKTYYLFVLAFVVFLFCTELMILAEA